jgi:hypothetical protein
MPRQILLNAFDMNCVGHIQHGMWTHPRDRSIHYNTLDYWQTLARTAEPCTLRRVIEQIRLGSRVAPIVGSADEVAGELIGLVEETGIDGFNLNRIVTPESLEDFVDLVVPILQERGVDKRQYAPGPLRQKLFGHARLPDSDPAATHRRRPSQACRTAAE